MAEAKYVAKYLTIQEQQQFDQIIQKLVDINYTNTVGDAISRDILISTEGIRSYASLLTSITSLLTVTNQKLTEIQLSLTNIETVLTNIGNDTKNITDVTTPITQGRKAFMTITPA